MRRGASPTFGLRPADPSVDSVSEDREVQPEVQPEVQLEQTDWSDLAPPPGDTPITNVRKLEKQGVLAWRNEDLDNWEQHVSED
jgi:hypothetical protein